MNGIQKPSYCSIKHLTNSPTGAGADNEDEEVVEVCDPLADDGPPGVPPSITAPAPTTNNPAASETDPVLLAANAGAPTPPTPPIPPLVPPPPPPPTPLAPLPLVLSGTLPDLEARRLLRETNKEDKLIDHSF